MIDVLTLAAVLVLAAGAAAWWRRSQGRAREAHGQLDPSARERLGVPHGRELLLLFTAPTCTTCDAARAVLTDVAGRRPNLALAEASVDDELSLARQHGVLRAPTVLLVGADGGVRARFAGVPAPDALGELVDG